MSALSPSALRTLCVAIAAATPAALVAQAFPEGKRPSVAEIKYHFDGGRKIDTTTVAARLRLKVGDEYSQGAADASVRALYATGLFQYVAVEPEKTGPDKVLLHVRLQPYLRIASIRFRGNTEWSGEDWLLSDLTEELEFKVGDALDEVKVKRSKEKIIKKYDKYYPFATVDSRIEPDGNGGATVIFDIDEGFATKVQHIRFAGNGVMSEQELRDVMDTATWAWTFDSQYFPGVKFLKFSWLTGWGRFHKEEFRQDLDKLRDYYRNQGFLDVDIPDKAAETNYVEKWEDDDEIERADGTVETIKKNRKGRMDVLVKVTEGRRYAVGTMQIDGNALGEKFSRFRADAILTVLAQRKRDVFKPYPYGDRALDYFFGHKDESDDPNNRRTDFDYLRAGDWYSPKAVDQAIDKVKDYYGEVGYLDCQVRVERKPNLETGKIDLIFHLREGEKSYLRSININGNTKTRSTVIVRELAISPGEVFDRVRMKTSEARLKNTRFFEEARLSDESTTIPHQKNLRISIKEGNTGSLTFGAGFSTVESLVGFAEYSESNFDLFNYRNYFRGGGQKFRFRVQIGTLSSAIEQSFEEPWVYERELAFGYTAYRRDTGYISTDYDVIRSGVQPYFRRRLFEQVYIQPTYRLENVEIDQIDASAPSFIQREKGSTLISAAGVTLTRDTRDNFIFPTYGNIVKLNNWVAGGPFGGQVSYYQIEARASQWIPMFDAGEQTLQLLARGGAMVAFDGRYVPFYERFMLGGAYDMRGFKYAHVGPFDGDEPTGGNTYGMFTAEYTVKIIEQLRLAFFYDWGFVNSAGFDFNPKSYNDDAGFGFRILVMGAVMKIDIGFPITASRNNDDGMRFNFSFGTSF